jgi:hypothetical protein
MFRRIEPDEPRLSRTGVEPMLARESEPVTAPQIALDADGDLLPHGHPKWVRDGVSISQRARDVVARLRPIVVRALRFWDHRLLSAIVGGRRVHVDASGSYRVE